MIEKKSFLKEKIDLKSPNKNIVPISTSIGSDGKLSLNFHGLMKENDFKKITTDKNIRNYSVKNEGDKYDISGFMIFDKSVDKDKFLNEWSSKINSYNVDLDDNN